MDRQNSNETDGTPPGLAVGTSSEAALIWLLQACVTEIDQHLAVFMESDDDAGPHKARVALRRLTTVLDGFRPLFRKSAWRALRAEAKAIFRQLGKVRDAQVFWPGWTAMAKTGAKTGLKTGPAMVPVILPGLKS